MRSKVRGGARAPVSPVAPPGMPPGVQAAPRLRSWAFCAVLVLAACTPGMPYQRPEQRLPDRYGLLVPVAAPAAEDRHWWRAFGDPVLDGLVTAALEGNLSLAEARARLAEAEAQAMRAGAARIGGDGRLELRRANPDGEQTAEAGVSVALDLSGGRGAEWRAALARLEAARAAEADARRLLVADLAATYVDLRFFQARQQQRQEDHRSRQRTLNDISAQVEAGAATELDRIRARALLAETRAELPRLDAAVLRQRNRISTLLGRPAGDLGLSLAYGGRQPLPRGLPRLGVPADLLRNRPDIARAERLYAAAVSDIDTAEAARYPSLSLSGLIRAPLAGGGTGNTLAAAVTLPLLSQPALAAGAQAARARAAAALAQWRRAVITAVEEVENALAALQGAHRAAQAAGQAVALNAEALTLTRRVIEERGNVTTLDLLDRERAVSEARGLLAQTRREVGLEYVALRTALGLGFAWETLEGGTPAATAP
ncbi:MAG TPA: efflux transporter outer membrane subunit [Paracoccaceae bacterium]|nr:efflux transporter outer membrane subunit [Paracoccaceae bacterium]